MQKVVGENYYGPVPRREYCNMDLDIRLGFYLDR